MQVQNVAALKGDIAVQWPYPRTRASPKQQLAGVASTRPHCNTSTGTDLRTQIDRLASAMRPTHVISAGGFVAAHVGPASQPAFSAAVHHCAMHIMGPALWKAVSSGEVAILRGGMACHMKKRTKGL